MSDLIDKDGKLLHEIFGDKYLRRLNTRAPVWEIAFQGSDETGFDDCLKSLLRIILDDFPNSYLSYSWDPIFEELKGEWIIVQKRKLRFNIYEIPSDIDFEEFYDFLRLGDWVIWKSELTDANINLFHSNQMFIDNDCLYMINENNPFYLHSFPDNEYIRIAINPFWKLD